ncbi:MAG TPA: FIST N-terminal domain-containing protein [Albitalea sp.]|uniref:FIST signal transduction protein n=1 Tax=Piscinibacter sp. TaxID=1903157 RepID=UPI002ED28E08
MKTLQLQVGTDAQSAFAPLKAFQPDLVLCFGAHRFFRDAAWHAALRKSAPGAVLAGCSGAGEIVAASVHDGTLAITALKFRHARARGAATRIAGMADSHRAGERLGAALPSDGLRHVLVFGTGVHINGSALVDGLRAALPAEVAVSGGLAGDGGAFVETFTLSDAGSASDQVVAVGLYGQALTIGNSSVGGWVPFGPARRVTRCEHNVLYELDGERALNIYKRYLGPYARDLPASGLLFPFELTHENDKGSGIIRTILGIDDDAGSLTLAGDVPEGGLLKLMHASTERLIDAAEQAALQLQPLTHDHAGPALALLVSCVGRKLVMGDRVDEEVEAVASVLGAHATVAGFYSYGEISRSEFVGDCRLHNQTMTITWLTES